VREVNLEIAGDGLHWASPLRRDRGDAAVVAEARPKGGPERCARHGV